MNKEPDGKFVPEQEGGRNDQNQKKGDYHPALLYAGADRATNSNPIGHREHFAVAAVGERKAQVPST